MFIIDDDNWQDHMNPSVNGQVVTRGGIPRDYGVQPVKMAAVQFPVIPREEWPERIRDMKATKSRLSDIRRRGNNGGPIPSLDQNGQGFCWFYGPTMSLMLQRALANKPYVRLSAHAGACKIKNFRDEGAWGALALDFLCKNGVPSIDKWAEKSMSRSYDTAETWEEAKQFIVNDTWADLAAPAWDRDLNIDQQATQLLLRNGFIGDYDFWGHCVTLMDLEDIHPDRSARDETRYGPRGLNSWTDAYGDMGEFVLADGKAWANNAVVLVDSMAA